MLLVCSNLQAKTYYYALEKIVTNNQHKSATGSGIFITFTNDGCYDSDYQGYTNNQSYLKLGYKGNYTVYSGTTYWGSGEYKFSSDLSRLNVIVGSQVYVYNRASAPMGVNNSKYIGIPKSTIENSSESHNMGGPGLTNNPGSNTDSRMSQEWYQNTYNRYANNAQSIYNSITSKLVDSNGNETRGYVYQPQDSQIAISGMIQNLRNVQRDMRDLRQEAARNGYRISKSSYEDIDIKRY